MRGPNFITFTGLDARTDLARAYALGRQFPLEWGVLLSPKRQGAEPRYPDGDTLSRILWSPLARQDPSLGTLAAHLCGDFSRSVMLGNTPSVTVDLWYFRRVQVNHPEPDPDHIRKLCNGWDIDRGIAQCRGATFPDSIRVDWLFDCSGGRGERPASWPAHPGGDRVVGYAGGIGPDNVRDVIEQIDAKGQYWIDMESGVRTDDWLDLDKCEAVCRAVFPTCVP